MKTRFIGPVLPAIGAISVCWASWRLWNSSEELSLARQRDASCASLIADVRALRALPAVVEESLLREERLLAMVSDCVSQAGINPAAIREASSEKSAAPGQTYQRQSIRTQLEGLSLPDVGRLLHHFAQNHPTWVPTTINLAPASRNAADGSSWNCSLVLTSTCLAESPSRTPLPEIPPR